MECFPEKCVCGLQGPEIVTTGWFPAADLGQCIQIMLSRFGYAFDSQSFQLSIDATGVPTLVYYDGGCANPWGVYSVTGYIQDGGCGQAITSEGFGVVAPC